MNKQNIKKFVLYLVRWQLSTPILALCMLFIPLNTMEKTIIANLIGGIIFFFVDKQIFKEPLDNIIKTEKKKKEKRGRYI